jgi:hypothetical protein
MGIGSKQQRRGVVKSRSTNIEKFGNDVGDKILIVVC